MNYIPNLSEIEQSAADINDLLQFLWSLEGWP